MIYKGFISGIVTRDSNTKTYKGVVVNTADYVPFQSDKFDDIENQFHIAIDEYLKKCAEIGKDPFLKNKNS